jgi:hypothetical protein
VTSKEYLSKNVNSRFYVGTSDFLPEIQEKLVPKIFLSRCMVPLANSHVTSKEYLSKNLNSRFYVGTSDFFPKIQEKLVLKTFQKAIT